jgi:F-type H+-transporting ATPase subunit a
MSSKVSSILFSSLFFYLLFLNLLSNLPFCASPSLYYYFSFTLSFIFCGSSIFIVFKRRLGSFVSHLIPYGAPMFLSVLLPVIELFSQLIRPLTLIIRLRTNLSAGHIMLYMFSLFSLSSSIAFFSIFVLSSLLIMLEVCISMLQAYIFVSLSHMYFVETV